MLRRGFLGSLAALFGFGSVAVASSPEPARLKQRSRFVRVYGPAGANNPLYANLDLVQSLSVSHDSAEAEICIGFTSGMVWRLPARLNEHLIETTEQGLA